LADLIDILFTIRAGAFSFEAADVRPFEDDLTLAVIRYGDEFAPEQCHACTIPALSITP
jgi:hypothetical protein